MVMAIVMAFIGWAGENVVILTARGGLDSRFHVLPFIPAYGLIVFALQIFVGDVNSLAPFGKKIFKTQNRKNKILSNLLCLVFIYLLVFLGELCVGNGWAALTGVELWNYSNVPLSVTQYAGLFPTLGYGTAAYIISKFFYGPFLRLLRRKMPHKVAVIINATLGALVLLDGIRMILQLIILKEAPLIWAIQVW